MLKEGLKHKGPVLMNFVIDRFENCYPMIPAGGAHHEMVLEDPPQLKSVRKSPRKKGENADAVLPA